jgi:hypothetical protein
MRRCPAPLALDRARVLADEVTGCVALAKIMFRWERSMLDCGLSDCEPSDPESGGVSAPELKDVQVLDRERDTGRGREKDMVSGPPIEHH